MDGPVWAPAPFGHAPFGHAPFGHAPFGHAPFGHPVWAQGRSGGAIAQHLNLVSAAIT